MYLPVPFPGQRRFTLAVVLFCVSAFALSALAQTPTPPPPAQEPAPKDNSTAKPSPAPAADQPEVTSQDTPTTFKVRVNLVLVHVVVRDVHGNPIPNLKKEDFQLQDNKKVQSITSFSVETPESHVRTVAAPGFQGSPLETPDATAGKPVNLPQRFVALVFDDVHMSIDDTMFVRNSADKFFKALAPTDRAAIYSTSGQMIQEFTEDQAALKEALLKLLPRSAQIHDSSDCPDLNYYQADLIVNKNDAQALGVATQETIQCAFNGDNTQSMQAQNLALAAAYRQVNLGDAESEYGYRHMEQIMSRLAGMPGQRILVFISPGYMQTDLLQLQTSGIVDRATRAGIVVNTIDARGLYTPDLAGDIASPARDTLLTAGYKTTYRVAGQLVQDDVLAQLADGTGGIFYHNRNDLDEAMREAGAAPAVSYLLGFSPQNLKMDGRFHTLKVTLSGKEKFSIQARHGYFAPRSLADPEETTKEEIQEALFSQEEIRDLPVDFQTQYFKKDQAESRLAVLTHLDVKAIHFRKAEGRNNDKLTIVTGIFDENGNFVTGGQKTLEMKLLDTTYARLSHSGITVKTSYDVKPGRYLVRLVVRDNEGTQMAARNGAVIIPD